jgi:hypothetical protein
MLPAEIACRRCAQQPGEPCITSYGSIYPDGGFHAERIEDAASMEVQGANIGKEEFDKALEQTGLV